MGNVTTQRDARKRHPRLKHLSPLRYPGGKGVLSELLIDVIDLNNLRGNAYFEAYAGGAGAALRLLMEGVVSEIYLNDADYRLYAFWTSVLDEPERFIRLIHEVPLTIEEWKKQRDICLHPDSHRRLDVGFAAFYMNRCNRSGILLDAGPIGGYSQQGKWRMDARFNRDTLSDRILNLTRFQGKIRVFNQDAIQFLKEQLPKGCDRKRILVYLDPPYVNKGQRLYLNAYEHKDHADLARYLLSQKSLHWILSYDDNNLVRNLYQDRLRAQLSANYTLQEKRLTHEVLIAPKYLITPLEHRVGRNRFPMKEVA